ncbi:hypothetical protein D3C81_1607120 [compost metagenome]
MPVIGLNCPAASEACAVMFFTPSAFRSVVVRLQLPLASTTTEPTTTPLTNTETSVSLVPVPTIVNSGSSVVSPFCKAPVTSPTSSNTWVIAGAAGASPAKVNSHGEVFSLTFPAASTASATKLWWPAINGSFGMKLHLPEASTAVLPISKPLS